MSCRTPQIVVCLVLLICLACPILEVFDRWDHTLQTGNDTEYTLVVLALCIGVAHTFARFTMNLRVFNSAAKLVFSFCAQKPVLLGARAFFTVLTSPNPPVLALRI